MNKKLSNTLIERGVIALDVTPDHYYEERYMYKDHPITNDISKGYLIWPEKEVKDRNWTEPKHVATLTEACDKIDEYHENKQKLIAALAADTKHKDVPPKALQDETDAILFGTQILREEVFKLPTENLTHNANLRLDTEFKVPSGPTYTYVACGGGGEAYRANTEILPKKNEIEDRIEQKVSYLDSHGCHHESQQAAINNEVLYDLGEIIEKYAHGQDMEVIWEDDSIVYQLALMLVRRKDEIMDLLYVYEEDKK